jgi:hypothetical protein
VAYIMDFYSAGLFINPVDHPITPGAEGEVPCQIPFESFPDVRILRQRFDRSLDERLQRRSQPQDLPAAVGRID